MSLVQKAQFLGVEKNGPSLDFCIWTKTRPDTLPGMSRVGWAGAVMLKNRREKSGDGPTDMHSGSKVGQNAQKYATCHTFLVACNATLYVTSSVGLSVCLSVCLSVPPLLFWWF